MDIINITFSVSVVMSVTISV